MGRGIGILFLSLLLTLAVALSASTYAGELPPRILAMQYLLEGRRALEAGNDAEVVKNFEKLLNMREFVDIPPVIYLVYANSLGEIGKTSEAYGVLMEYLNNPNISSQEIARALNLKMKLEAAMAKTDAILEIGKKIEELAKANALNGKNETLEVELPGGVVVGFRQIPAGTFIMGSPASERRRDNDEVQHQVMLTTPFYLGVYEVTQEQWQAVMGNNSRYFEFKGGKQPVETVSWHDATEFCRKASQMTGRKFRLPTEAEWEYACRAGTETAYNTGDSLGENQANYDSRQTREVGSYSPNAWGLYDMHGNVWEWCSDWYGDYPNGSVSDPKGPGNGRRRVLRGGSWDDSAADSRSADRDRDDPGDRDDDVGFRIALDP